MTTPRRQARALHPPGGLRSGGWWACHHPDWPPAADLTAFDPQCDGCTGVLREVERLSAAAGVTVTMTGREASGIERTDAGTTIGERLARIDRDNP